MGVVELGNPFPATQRPTPKNGVERDEPRRHRDISTQLGSVELGHSPKSPTLKGRSPSAAKQ